MALSTDLTTEALRQQCAQRGIAMRKVARQQDGTTRLKRRHQCRLSRFFAWRPGPAAIEPAPVATVSGSAKKVRRIVQTPAWCRSKERKEADRKRLAEPAAKEATRKRMAEPAAKEANRKRMAEPAAKEATRKCKAEPAAKDATRKRNAKPAAQLADAQRKSAKRQRVLQARAQRQEEVLTWATHHALARAMIITWATHHAPDTASTSSGQALPAPVTRGSSSQAAADSTPVPPEHVTASTSSSQALPAQAISRDDAGTQHTARLTAPRMPPRGPTRWQLDLVRRCEEAKQQALIREAAGRDDEA